LGPGVHFRSFLDVDGEIILKKLNEIENECF